MTAWLRSLLFYCIGVVISTLCAIILAHLYSGTNWEIEGPLLFTIALVILASHFGAMISVPGAFLGAAMFAFFLYNPQNSFRINDETERSALAWMVLTSIALSYLLYPTRRVPPAVQTPALNESSRSDAAQVETGHEVRHEIAKPSTLPSGGEVGAGVGNRRSDGQGRG